MVKRIPAAARITIERTESQRVIFVRIFVFLLVATAGFGAGRHSTISLRKRVHVNPLITDPGTFELDWSGAVSMDGTWSFPSAVRFAPAWGRTEFSASFDARRFDRPTFAATLVAFDSDHFDIAVAPTVARGDNGWRGGGLAIVRYDGDRNTGGLSAQWIAGTVDLGAGYGRMFRKRFTAHVNGQWEKSTGTARQIAVSEGVEYQITDPLAVDLSAQHGTSGNQIIVGVTFRTPRLKR